MTSKKSSKPNAMLRGKGRIIVLIMCCLLILYLVYLILFSDFRGSQKQVKVPPVSHSNKVANQMLKMFPKYQDNKPLVTRTEKTLIQYQLPEIKINKTTEVTKGFTSSIKSFASLDLFKPTQIHNNMFYTPCSAKVARKFKDFHKLIHLDLKGAPPRISYLKQLFPFFSKLGATGLLIEFEDTLPYYDKLSDISSGNAYKMEEVREIIKLARDSGLKLIIPLVQTFGHLEFVLKLDKYRHLRETDVTPQVIAAHNRETYELLESMINQTISVLGGAKGLQYFHIGCDEVYQLGSGKIKTYMNKMKISPTDIFFEHVTKVAEIVRKHHLTPILWDDMFRKLSYASVKKYNLTTLVQPMIWQYWTRPQDSLPKDLFSKYRKMFQKVWIASSFKGATGSFKYVTDVAHHLSNHLNWIEIVKSNDLSFVNGFTLTGWQRYDHFATLCELLPVAIPSLAFSLHTLSRACFDKISHDLLSTEILGCGKLLNISLLTLTSSRPKVRDWNPPQCKFPGSDLYSAVYRLYHLELLLDQDRITSRWRSWLNSYNVLTKFSSPGQLKVLKKLLDPIYSSLIDLHDVLDVALKKIYDDSTVTEWMHINYKRLKNRVENIGRTMAYLSKEAIWKQRPLYLSSNIPDRIDRQSVNKPPVIRDSIDRQSINKPPVIRDSMDRQSVNKPPVVRDSMDRQSVNKPHVIRDSIERQSVNKPPVIRDSIDRQSVNKPPVIRDRIDRQSVNKPPVIRDSIDKRPVYKQHVVRDNI